MSDNSRSSGNLTARTGAPGAAIATTVLVVPKSTPIDTSLRIFILVAGQAAPHPPIAARWAPPSPRRRGEGSGRAPSPRLRGEGRGEGLTGVFYSTVTLFAR